MSLDNWVLYLGTVLVFMSTPGPSHLLMLSNSVVNGFTKSISTAYGDLSANLLQMLAASIGLASILTQFQSLFIIIKWAGVVYLVYVGLKLILTRSEAATGAQNRSKKQLYWQGFITSAANPKAILFFAALFPQFIAADQPLVPQFLVLSATYLCIDGLFLCTYGKFASSLSLRFSHSAFQHINTFAGGLMVGAAILLGFKGIEPS